MYLQLLEYFQHCIELLLAGKRLTTQKRKGFLQRAVILSSNPRADQFGPIVCSRSRCAVAQECFHEAPPFLIGVRGAFGEACLSLSIALFGGVRRCWTTRSIMCSMCSKASGESGERDALTAGGLERW